MVEELKDGDILQYLMTSDFDNNLSPDELRFLLMKFRYFYRISSSKNELLLSDMEILRRSKDEKIKNLESQLIKIGLEKQTLEINKPKRKRILGWI